MKSLKFAGIILLMLLLNSFNSVHKYYISNTQIEYVKEKQSVQIITRLFIDDFENVLQERYDEHLNFDDENDELVDVYVEKYLTNKLKVTINNIPRTIVFIGKEIDAGIVKCYLEIEKIERIDAFQITNQALFDLFAEQQNIIKLNINSKQKSYILTKQNDKALLNFD